MSKTVKELRDLGIRSSVTEMDEPSLVVDRYRHYAIVENEADGFTSKEQIDSYIEKYAEPKLEGTLTDAQVDKMEK